MIRSLAGDSTWARYSLVWSGIQAVAIIAFESVIFKLHTIESYNIQNAIPAAKTILQQPPRSFFGPYNEALVLQSTRVLSAYHVIFIVAQLFQLILLCDAMFNKNTIQIIAIVVFNWAMVGYAGVQVKQASDILVRDDDQYPIFGTILDIFEARNTPYHASKPYEFTVLGLMIILASVFAFVAYRLYKEFGWSIYKKIGADLAMRDMYKVYQIFIMILKFDIFFQLGFSAQFLAVVILQHEIEDSMYPLSATDMRNILIVHLILSTGASIVLPFLAWWSLKRESKIAMSCFLTGAFGTLVYNIYKLSQVTVREADRFAGAQKFLIFFYYVVFLLD
ncbi:hypothetical protein BGZ49_008386, partial [Haplosporangium sp. Z 27]